MKVLCHNCNLKTTPIFNNHTYNGHERIIFGKEIVFNGLEFINKTKKVYNYKCPYCNTVYKKGYCIK